MKVDAAAYLRLIDIGRALSAEKDIDSLLERILVEAKTMANADAGSLYLAVDDEVLSFAIVFNDTLNITHGGNSGDPVTLPDIPLRLASGEPNMINIATQSANLGKVIIIDDLYQSKDFDSSGAKKFDELTGYQSRSFLTLPLTDSKEKTLGILQLLNAKNEQGEAIAFPEDVVPLMEALASQASLALENRHLLDEQVVLRKQLEIEVDARTEELKNALKKSGAPLAGEMSGHIFFNDQWYGFDDGHYSAFRLIEIISQMNESLASIFGSLPKAFSTPEINIEVEESQKFRIVEDFIKNAEFSEGTKITIDGLRINFQDGWGLLRASNTTPKLVLRFEAKTSDRLVEIQNLFLKQLKQIDESIKIELS